MKKVMTMFGVVLFTTIFFSSCEQRREFCDCKNLDLSKALMESITLSKKELEAREKACKWIEEEMSKLEILQKIAECSQENN
jgi:hypothetical protein